MLNRYSSLWVFALLLVCSCSRSHGASGASPIHEWFAGGFEPWLEAKYPDSSWVVGGGGGGGGEHSSSSYRAEAKLTKEERDKLAAFFLLECEKQITRFGGEIGGRGGSPPEAFKLTYDLGHTTGGVFVHIATGEDGWTHIAVSSYEVR